MSTAATYTTAVHIVEALRQELRALARPEDAEPMRAYAKSTMPCLGVKTGPRRKAVAAVLEHSLLNQKDESYQALWSDTIFALWDGATHREERHAALDIANWSRAKVHRNMAALPLCRHLAITGAWWDLVDPVATLILSDLVLAHRAQMTPVMVAWSQEENLWLRRCAILCQLKHRDQVDTKLLYGAIRGSWDDPDFFARKAIGWALRERTRTAPGEVMDFVRANHDKLSPLSRKEALRLLKNV